MGRKSVPFVDESSLLRSRLRDALECEELALSLGDEHDAGFTVSPESGAPAGLTLEDLYRLNRNRARLIGLLHTHRSYHGAPIIVLVRDQAMTGEIGLAGWASETEDEALTPFH
jgi:hypothetical protein